MLVFPGDNVTTTASNFWKKPGVDYIKTLQEVGSWNAGAHAPQWVEFDFNDEYCIDFIQLKVSQVPAGNVYHKILAGTKKTNMKTIHKIKQHLNGGEELEINIKPISVRYLKIESIESPSWIAWLYIKIGNNSSKRIKSARK